MVRSHLSLWPRWRRESKKAVRERVELTDSFQISETRQKRDNCRVDGRGTAFQLYPAAGEASCGQISLKQLPAAHKFELSGRSEGPEPRVLGISRSTRKSSTLWVRPAAALLSRVPRPQDVIDPGKKRFTKNAVKTRRPHGLSRPTATTRRERAATSPTAGNRRMLSLRRVPTLSPDPLTLSPAGPSLEPASPSSSRPSSTGPSPSKRPRLSPLHEVPPPPLSPQAAGRAVDSDSRAPHDAAGPSHSVASPTSDEDDEVVGTSDAEEQLAVQFAKGTRGGAADRELWEVALSQRSQRWDRRFSAQSDDLEGDEVRFKSSVHSNLRLTSGQSLEGEPPPPSPTPPFPSRAQEEDHLAYFPADELEMELFNDFSPSPRPVRFDAPLDGREVD